MRKRWLSLLLALVMLASVTVTTASADTVNLSDKTVTLSVTPSQSAICVGSTGDVYVTYTISIKADVPIPAFQFRLPADAKLATQVQSNDPNWYYWFNTAELKQSDGKENGNHGPYKVADYTPDTGYVGVGGSDDGKGLTSVTVMTTVAKFEKNSVTNSTTYDLHSAITDFVAGGAKDDGGVNTANAFGNCVVNGATVTVNPGATVSGTVKDSSGKAVSGAAVELYKDGTKVATATVSGNTYSFSTVSTGTYTVKAKATVDGKELNGSASVTVADGDTTKDVTIAKGVTVSGTVKSYGGASEVVTVTLTKQGETTPAFTDTLTGNSAAYKFENVSAGTYTLKVEKKGHAPWTESITVGDGNVTKDVTVYQYGDVNRNGTVTVLDASWIRQHLVGKKTFDEYQLQLADVNKSGNISVLDASWIRQRLVGIRNEYYEKIN